MLADRAELQLVERERERDDWAVHESQNGACLLQRPTACTTSRLRCSWALAGADGWVAAVKGKDQRVVVRKKRTLGDPCLKFKL